MQSLLGINSDDLQNFYFLCMISGKIKNDRSHSTQFHNSRQRMLDLLQATNYSKPENISYADPSRGFCNVLVKTTQIFDKEPHLNMKCLLEHQLEKKISSDFEKKEQTKIVF